MTKRKPNKPKPNKPKAENTEPDYAAMSFTLGTPEGWDRARRFLVAFRKGEGLTQTDVAKHMGVSQSQVSEFERGLTDPYVSTIARYIRAVGLRPHMHATDQTTDKEST